MVAPVVDALTRISIAPGVHAGSGRPPWLMQPEVFVRGAGFHVETPATASRGATPSSSAAVGARLGGEAVATTDGSVAVAVVGTGETGVAAGADAGGVADEQAVNTSAVATIMQRTSTSVVWG